MEKVKDSKEYKIYKKGNDRYAVTDLKGAWINGEKKVEILRAEKLIKPPMKKKEVPAEAAAEAPAAE